MVKGTEEIRMTYEELIENNICPYCKAPLTDRVVMGEKKKFCSKCEQDYDPVE